MNKKLSSLLAAIALPAALMAQGWPTNFEGVMLQGFYWNSYDATNWKNLESQADELSQYFKLIWVPQSGNCGAESMGYDDLYWFDNYNSAFGSEQELRSMISTFRQKGLYTIADVVINHRKTLSNWVDFPKETYNGTTYQLLSTDICKDDCNGETAAWAKKNGYELSQNNDTGEGASFARDLDHNSLNVQQNVKAYLDFLLHDLGYSGVRYDMVKGYAPRFTGIYNAAAKPEFSVGEYFDGDKQNLVNWINGTKVDGTIQSAAFDFATRYAVRDAVNTKNWKNLANASLARDPEFARYAITFVENHDTQVRSDNPQDPIRQDTLAANAYILAMPGTPCVFLRHWIDWKPQIKEMILLRNFVGINNQSSFSEIESSTTDYSFVTTGSHGKLYAVVGTMAGYCSPKENGWALAAEGKGYRYFLERSQETAWVSLPSGTYYGNTSATLRAISQNDGARIVYTTDGSMPTASSTAVDNGTTISLPNGDYTMKAGLLIGGTVSGIVERHYSIKDFKPYAISVNVNTDNVGWTSMNVWSWGGDGSHGTTATQWPGDEVTTKTTVDGKQWYTMSYTMNSKDDYVNFVFNTDNGAQQTVNVQNINRTSFIEILTEKDDKGHYKTLDVTDQHVTAISNAVADRADTQATRVATLGGQTVRIFPVHVSTAEAISTLPHGIYIVNGKKIVK